MSAPTSTKMLHPLYIDAKIRKNYLIGYILFIWLSCIPSALLELIYANLWIIYPNLSIIFLILLVPNILLAYYLIVFTSLILMKISLIILNSIHKPKEGIFPRDLKNKDYKFHSLRNYVRLFSSYIIASTPFPWFRNFLFFKMFNIQIGEGGTTWDFWITPEFIEIGNRVIIGHSTVIQSSMVEQDKLIIKKIKIEDDVIIASKVFIFPGVTIKKGAELGAGTYLLPFTTVEENKKYFGTPGKSKS